MKRVERSAVHHSPRPQLWASFPSEVHQQLVTIWTELLQRQLPSVTGREELGTSHEHGCVLEDPGSSLAATGRHLHPTIDAAPGSGESREHPLPVSACRSGDSDGLALAPSPGRR